MAIIKEYIINDDNTVRYVLGKYIDRPLIVFGINPSVATAEKNDNTIGIIEHIAEMRNCDGYLMFNLYPLRATKIKQDFPKDCDKKSMRIELSIHKRTYSGRRRDYRGVGFAYSR